MSEKNLDSLVAKMTLEEKASLCSGHSFWTTKAFKRYGIPSIRMSDGPHGIRRSVVPKDEVGFFGSVKEICFPTASAWASSWNVDLIEKMGMALGEECQAEGIDMLLGPGVNIMRTPLCGRNFEYISEDPYLTALLGAAWVKGLQWTGIGACVKHFTANNTEFERMTLSSEMDERTLREIYLFAFEYIVKNEKPWAIMSAYNRLNGVYCSENKYLLTDILRKEWGFNGIVISDWGAVDNRLEALKAGLNLEMPTSFGVTNRQIVEAVESGKLNEKILDESVKSILRVIIKGSIKKNKIKYNKDLHHKLARAVARESIVLLKNVDHILPLDKEKLNSVAVIGAMAKHPRYQGNGSSKVRPTWVEKAYDEIVQILGDKKKIKYAKGYSLDHDEPKLSLVEEAMNTAAEAEVAIVFAGLPDQHESESYDREHMNMPENHVKLIEAVAQVQKNVIVVLSNGSAVSMKPWDENVKGVIEGWLIGEAGGSAIAEVLFGIVNPSGKLSVTIPNKFSDSPSYLTYPGSGGVAIYAENIFVGYRYYDKKGMDVAYPFGFGLSYTTFEYRDFEISKKDVFDTDTIEVSVKVKNTGKCFGKEVVQLYIKDLVASELRPERELKGFTKIALEPEEEKKVAFKLRRREFSFYSIEAGAWIVEPGDFKIMIGRSSREIRYSGIIYMKVKSRFRKRFTRYTSIGKLMHHPKVESKLEQLLTKMIGFQVLLRGKTKDRYVTAVKKVLREFPIHKLIIVSRGEFTEEMLQNLLEEVNEEGER